MTDVPGTARLAVLGSPIAHSKSPALHRAAYEVLGFDGTYDAIEVASGGLEAFIAGLGPEWRGLSLTMPLKREVLPLLSTRDELVDVVGAANTVLIADGLHGFNTDVAGIIAAFREAGVDSLTDVHVLGGGATAASVLAAVRRLGAESALVSVRDPERARSLEPVAAKLGMTLIVRPLGIMDRSLHVPSAVISTLPGGADAGIAFPEAVRHDAVLFDVAYDPWPSLLAQQWSGMVVSGLSMLLHQAVAQVRIFTTGASEPLPDEERIVAAMRVAVGL